MLKQRNSTDSWSCEKVAPTLLGPPSDDRIVVPKFDCSLKSGSHSITMITFFRRRSVRLKVQLRLKEFLLTQRNSGKLRVSFGRMRFLNTARVDKG